MAHMTAPISGTPTEIYSYLILQSVVNTTQQKTLTPDSTTLSTTAGKIDTYYPTLLPTPQTPDPGSLEISSPTSLSFASGSSLSEQSSTPAKVENVFSLTAQSLPVPSEPPSFPESTQIVTIHTSPSPTASKRSPTSNHAFSVNSVFTHIYSKRSLPHFIYDIEKIGIAQTAVEFALFFNGAQQHAELCLAAKIEFETAKHLCLTRGGISTDTPELQAAQERLVLVQTQCSAFYKTYADTFMSHFRNSAMACCAFRDPLVSAYNLKTDYSCLKFDFEILEFIHFSNIEEMRTARTTKILDIFLGELIVRDLLLKLEKCHLTLFSMRLQFEKSIIEPTHKVKKLRNLMAQIDAIKQEKNELSNEYIQEVFPKYSLQGKENKQCKALLNQINTNLALLEKDINSDVTYSKAQDGCCIIL